MRKRIITFFICWIYAGITFYMNCLYTYTRKCKIWLHADIFNHTQADYQLCTLSDYVWEYLLFIHRHLHICIIANVHPFFGSLDVVLYVFTHRHLFSQIFKTENICKLECTFMCIFCCYVYSIELYLCTQTHYSIIDGERLFTRACSMYKSMYKTRQREMA